jgi:hypothetical protein
MDDVIPCAGNNATGFRIMMILWPDVVEGQMVGRQDDQGYHALVTIGDSDGSLYA